MPWWSFRPPEHVRDAYVNAYLTSCPRLFGVGAHALPPHAFAVFFASVHGERKLSHKSRFESDFSYKSREVLPVH
jgi:hypothetical protein